LENVTNLKRGDYYGIAKSWPINRQRRYGVYLLHMAMLQLLLDGDKQLRVKDIQSD
jgi:hypothetical protein